MESLIKIVDNSIKCENFHRFSIKFGEFQQSLLKFIKSFVKIRFKVIQTLPIVALKYF